MNLCGETLLKTDMRLFCVSVYGYRSIPNSLVLMDSLCDDRSQQSQVI